MRNANEASAAKGREGIDVAPEPHNPEQKQEQSASPAEVEVPSTDAAEEEMNSTESSKADATAGGASGTQEGSEDAFARLVKGWEALAQAGARNVQRARANENFQPLQMLQNLSLCGAKDGLTRIGGEDPGDTTGDPFEPIVLRHTHSTPLQYSTMFPNDDGGPALPPIRLDNMRRSSSTPSSTAFRQRSEGSAFGTHLRSMPHLGGADDRSAFTLPAQRNSFTSLSDSGIRYSAFDPVMLPQSMMDSSEDASIEVTDVKPAATKATKDAEEEESGDLPNKNTATRASRFLRMSDVRNLRRRKRRSGRENPARPPSISSSSPGDDENSKTEDSVEGEPISSKPSANPTTSPGTTTYKSTIDVDMNSVGRASATVSFPTVHETGEDVDTNRKSGASGDQYHQLDSDVDEEYEHYQRIETSLQTDSPTPIPSPAYQQFEDEQVAQPMKSTGRSGVGGDISTPTVRIQVSTGQTTPDATNQEGNSLTPVSQESGNQSPGTIRSTMTGNTSGHTTIATSTSATVSSGHMSVLSSVSETDIEVMETNQAGKMRIRQQRKLDKVVKQGGDPDSSASVHSSSTASTNTHGYVALAGSPAPLREGASLPVDRFFNDHRIPVAHSTSINSGSTGSSGSASGPANTPRKASDISPSKQGSPGSMLSEMANTNSSSSTGEDPPEFVSYLDQETKSRKNTLPPVDDAEERASPAEIVGYSAMVFEAANTPPGQESQKPTLIRPMQQSESGRGDRSGRFGSRPPLSPIKGLRTPTTPPPMSAVNGPDSTPPSYHQLSPPRNIIDHRMGAGLSKPYVLRSSARAGDTRSKIFVSPDEEGSNTSENIQSDSWAQGVVTSDVGGVVSPKRADAVYTYSAREGHELGVDPHSDRIYEEMSIEVKDMDENMSEPANSLVTPEKGA